MAATAAVVAPAAAGAEEQNESGSPIQEVAFDVDGETVVVDAQRFAEAWGNQDTDALFEFLTGDSEVPDYEAVNVQGSYVSFGEYAAGHRDYDGDFDQIVENAEEVDTTGYVRAEVNEEGEVETSPIVDVEVVEVTSDSETSFTVSLEEALDEDVDADDLDLDIEVVDADGEEIDAGELTFEISEERDSVVVTHGDLTDQAGTITVEGTDASFDNTYDLDGNIEEAEEAIAGLEDADLSDRAEVQDTRALINEILDFDEDAEIEGLADFEELEADLDEQVENLSISNISLNNSTSFNIELDEDVTGLSSEDFDITLNIEDGDEVELEDFDLEAQGEGVFTVTHDDLAGEEGEIEVTYVPADDDSQVEFDFTDDAVDDAVDEVNDAIDDDDEDALLEALQAPQLDLADVNEDFISQYFAEIDDSFTNTVERIQSAVDRTNEEFAESVEESLETLNTTASQTAFLEALTSLETTIAADDVDEIVNDDDADVDGEFVDGVDGVELTDYFEAIQDAQPETLAELEEIIEDVNVGLAMEAYDLAVEEPTEDNIEDAEELLEAFEDLIDDSDELLEDLEDLETTADVNDALDSIDDESSDEDIADAFRDAGFENVTEDNAEAYFEAFEDQDALFTSSDEVQDFIDEVNAQEIADDIEAVVEAIEDEDDEGLREALNELDLDTDEFNADLLADNDAGEALRSQLMTTFADVEFETDAEIESALTTTTQIANVESASESEMDAALRAINYDTYVDLGSDRPEIAALFTATYGDEDFDSISEIEEAIDSTIEQRDELLSAVNSEQAAGSISGLLSAMEDVEEAFEDTDYLNNQLQFFVDADDDDAEAAINELDGDFSSLNSVEVDDGPDATEGEVTYINSDGTIVEIDGETYNAVGDAQTLFENEGAALEDNDVEVRVNSEGEIYRIDSLTLNGDIDGGNLDSLLSNSAASGLSVDGNENSVTSNSVTVGTTGVSFEDITFDEDVTVDEDTTFTDVTFDTDVDVDGTGAVTLVGDIEADADAFTGAHSIDTSDATLENELTETTEGAVDVSIDDDSIDSDITFDVTDGTEDWADAVTAVSLDDDNGNDIELSIEEDALTVTENIITIAEGVIEEAGDYDIEVDVTNYVDVTEDNQTVIGTLDAEQSDWTENVTDDEVDVTARDVNGNPVTGLSTDSDDWTVNEDDGSDIDVNNVNEDATNNNEYTLDVDDIDSDDVDEVIYTAGEEDVTITEDQE